MEVELSVGIDSEKNLGDEEGDFDGDEGVEGVREMGEGDLCVELR